MFEMRLGGAFTQPCVKWKTSDERRNTFRLRTNNNPVRNIQDRSCCAAIWMNLLWCSQKKFETSNSAWIISAAGLTRETKEELHQKKSCLFRWADKCKIKKKMNKINHGCKVIGHICKVDRRWREKLVCLFNAFTTELSSAIVITPWAEGWKYSTSTLSYVRKSSNSFRDPHSQCWAMRLCTDRHVIVCWAWLAINWRR